MAYVLVSLLINLILFWQSIDGTVIIGTVYPIVLQQVPDRISGTIAIANSSNEEIFWDHVDFEKGEQFPLNFSVVISDSKILLDRYILQLHIYKIPRNQYDLPLWSADAFTTLARNQTFNSVSFRAYNDRKSFSPCILGIILSVQPYTSSLLNKSLIVKIGSMPLITLYPHLLMQNFPLLFTITDIPISQIRNSTIVSVLISDPKNIITYEAKETAVFASDLDCTTLLFRVSEERSMNLTVTMSAHVFTSVLLLSLAATYRIYRTPYLLYEQSEIIDTLEFPFTTRQQLIPIITPTNYSIEATIFGSIPGYSSGVILFEGVTYARLIPGTNNNVKISMLYTGPKIGTTIIGTVYRTPSNLSTWPLKGSNLAFVLDDQVTKLAESDQFTIFDQTFPIQFTMLNVKSITRSNQNVVFDVTITYRDGTVIWEGITTNNRIIYDQLNRLDMNVSVADGYACRKPGEGYCDSVTNSRVNNTCCSQFKCFSGQCKLIW